MKNKQETFAGLMQSFQYKYDKHTVFDDFLTMTIAAFGHNPLTKKSYDEDLYLETIAKYKNSNLRFTFPKLLAAVTLEMEERTGGQFGNDVLGDYYELNLTKKGSGQFFTPWPVCQFMAKSLGEATDDTILRVLDPSCGSGRMLLAGTENLGRQHQYYGIDIDHVCVKMAAINLFLNGIFHAEVMCADALMPGDFRVSYVTSSLPFGIFRITEKEKSPLWQSYNQTFKLKPKVNTADLKLPSETNDGMYSSGNSQLQLF